MSVADDQGCNAKVYVLAVREGRTLLRDNWPIRFVRTVCVYKHIYMSTLSFVVTSPQKSCFASFRVINVPTRGRCSIGRGNRSTVETG